MPRSTSEFKGLPDYQEAFQNADKEYVFIGHPDDLEEYKQDIYYNQEASQYFGCALLPERRQEEWNYEKNKAFFAGAIDAKRSMLLISNIEHFKVGGTTVDELFWLQDNGYEFRLLQENPLQTLAIPTNVSDNPQIRDYDKGKGTEKMLSWTARRIRFIESIKNPILQMRSQSSTQPTPFRLVTP